MTRAHTWPTRLAAAGRELTGLLPGSDSLWRTAGPAALAVAAVLLATASRYGLHGDELYFRMLPAAWWYDDQPPLTVWLTRLAAAASDAAWVQRLPAVAAAAAGPVVAALFVRLAGHGPAVQRVAAWAYAGAAYPLIVGHVFLTATLDLLAWQVVILLVLAATLGRPRALIWAGVAAGLACWNKLLILVLVAALAGALLAVDRATLRRREALVGGLAVVALGGFQVLAQVLHGWPMAAVSGDLIARHGALNRWLVLPLLVAFVGPPLARVCWRGLGWRPARAGAGPVLGVAATLLVAWTLAFPAQPYYPVAAFLPALALGWGPVREGRYAEWRHARPVLAANAVVAAVLALPLLPVGTSAFTVASAINPVARDQAAWPGYVRQLAAVADADTTVVTDSYALAGAVAYHGPALGLDRVASGHNAAWSLGPPPTEQVLLVGPIAISHRDLFAHCVPAAALLPGESDPFRVAGSPMARCSAPIGGWAAVWPQFRRLGG